MPPGAARVPGAGAPKVYSLGAFLKELYANDISGESDYLTARCFQVAANTEWRVSPGTLVSIWLLQFAGPAGAQSYALGQAQINIGLLDGHGRYASVSGIPAGRIVQTPQLDKFGNRFARMFGYSGNVAILLHVFRPAYLPSEASAERILREQARRLAQLR